MMKWTFWKNHQNADRGHHDVRLQQNALFRPTRRSVVLPVHPFSKDTEIQISFPGILWKNAAAPTSYKVIWRQNKQFRHLSIQNMNETANLLSNESSADNEKTKDLSNFLWNLVLNKNNDNVNKNNDNIRQQKQWQRGPPLHTTYSIYHMTWNTTYDA